MPLFQKYKYVLVMICVFSDWLKAFPCKGTMALIVGKKNSFGEFPLSYIMTKVRQEIVRKEKILEVPQC